MEKQVHNRIVTLQRVVNKPPPTKLSSHRASISQNGDFCVPGKQSALLNKEHVSPVALHSRNLTDTNFSVTRARAHALARKDEGGLKRVLNAALSGGDVRVASVVPASLLSRLVAAALLPAMLIMPLVPAYANEAPLSDRVASDVAAFVQSEGLASVDVSPAQDSSTQTDTTLDVAISDTTAPETQDSSTQTDTPIDPAPSDTVTPTDVATDPVANIPPSPSGEVAGVADTPPTQDVSSSSTEPIPPVLDGGDVPSSTASTTEEIANDPVGQPAPDEAPLDTQILDIPSEEVALDLGAIRERVRDELRNEVKTEVRKEVEEEVYRGCKNLDGMGYYCIPDAKSFGAAVISNERAITAVVQQDAFDGDKEIFVSIGDSTMQLTHNSDDDVFPVLDPVGDTLVWQTLVSGHWQISYAHMNDPGVPKVHQLTSGENNFNPKVYRGRIAWQAWMDGNWEIVVATPAREFIPEDARTAEHRLLGIGGEFELRRATANSAPDMFPTISDNTVTWQAIDGGVWQVFVYDLSTGESRRVSKPGVKSESPSLALVWNEETESGEMKLVGADVYGGAQFDFTALARKLADRSKKQPDTPLTTTEIIVVQPGSIRIEENIDAPVI